MQPTTALDVAIQAQILDLVRKLQRENGMSVLLITHDLGVIAEMCDRVAVMYAGRVVEFGSVLDILDRAAHPYTRGLLASRPKISDGVLLVDVGQIFIEDVERAALRLPALEAARAVWLEEPFHASALEAYGALARRCTRVKLAGGEGAHNASMARHLIDYGQIGFVQIDCGRIGGIGPAKQVADYAVARGVTYVNHTFTSHLALSASLQPFAGLRQHRICEYPVALKALAIDLTVNHLTPDAAGEITAPDAPGLGITINAQAVQQYRVEVDIRVNGKTLYLSPAFQS